MKYSVVMPVYLREDSHREIVSNTIESIRENSQDYELIIVDDGSPLNTSFLRTLADTYIRQPNQGISRGWNVGMLLASGENIAIVNDDILVPSGWLESLASVFDLTETGVSAPILGGPSFSSGQVGGVTENRKFYPGYCFMLKRDRFFEPFDIQFRTNCGDVDYWHRVESAGLKLMRAPISIWHKEGGVLHGMDYAKISESSIKLFEEKHGFNPQQKYYS